MDLFYRLNVVRLHVPPLRERREDIAPLVRQFTRSLRGRAEAGPDGFPSESLRRLEEHDWPGNVRELRNVVERACLLGRLPEECIEGEGAEAPVVDGRGTGAPSPPYPEDLPLGDVERFHALRVLRAAGGNKSEAARRLGIGRKTLERKLRQWAASPG